MRGVEVVGPSSCEVDIIRFRNLKKITSAVDPPTAIILPVSQVPRRTVDPIVEMVREIMGVNSSLEEALFSRQTQEEQAFKGYTQEAPQKNKGDKLKCRFRALEA